jgi:hypothetical protein
MLITLFKISLASTVWCSLLTTKGHLFSFMRMKKLPVYIRKPLFECVTCNSGQLALWYHVITYRAELFSGSFPRPDLLITIALNIFTVMALTWIIDRILTHI